MHYVKLVAQILLMVLMVISFFWAIYRAIEGEAARPATGFRGVVRSIFLSCFTTALWYCAGVFSEIFGGP